MPSPSYRLEPLPGYAPTIGRLAGILLYARQTTLAAVEGLSVAELDHLQDGSSNSIGALLAHIAAVERGYQCVTFEERQPSALEQAAWEPALKLGAEGRRLLRNKPLEHYVHELGEVRRVTLEALATRDDAWLEQPLRAAPAMNAHFAWFHVAEDEINHRGQMRWLRSRLGDTGRAVISAMLAVPDAPKAVAWYKQALGADELWNLGSVAGLQVSGAPFFVGEPANNGWESPSKLGITSARVEVFCDAPDAFIARAVEAGANGSLDKIRDHAMPWGPHRQGGFVDPFGHIWLVGDRSPLSPHRE